MYEHSNKQLIVGVDVGGSHITAGLIKAGSNELVENSIVRKRVDNDASLEVIIEQWASTIRECVATQPAAQLTGIAFAMPGPFNYAKGICLMKGVNKYDALYNVNIKQLIKKQCGLDDDLPVVFANDASCFGLGESLLPGSPQGANLIAVTLGTGFGATFLSDHNILSTGDNIPEHGELYNQPYLGGIAEDYVSGAWILKRYNELSTVPQQEVKRIAELALEAGDVTAQQVMNEFGLHLAACILPWIKAFKPACLVIGGNIARSSRLFLRPLQDELAKHHIDLTIKISTLMEISAIVGAASLLQTTDTESTPSKNMDWRKTSQELLPDNTREVATLPGQYNMYPFHNIGADVIFAGYQSLAEWIIDKKVAVIDGYGGNDWQAISEALQAYFTEKKITVRWVFTTDFLRQPDEIESLVAPFLGEPASVWGTRTTLTLRDFYDAAALAAITPDEQFDLNIFIGPGAAWCGWNNIIYFDLPKNEIQYRMRAGSITNLGNTVVASPAMMYKRLYFVDWIVYNKHRQSITSDIAVIADGQWKTTVTWSLAASIKQGLEALSVDTIRARPWFDAGAWGGNWMKQHIPQINQREVNYAWSFELIAPENGIVLESNQHLLEISFDWLMELQTVSVLGKDAAQFGTEFPIRFDFLDTFDGGNLSIQCHPSLQYIRENFGETITQDETYYILDCKADAKVYLGFQEDIDPEQFKSALEHSVDNNEAIDIEKYVRSFPSHKHDLFLIPNGTIHSSGVNNMVLEISATPYIFTFKMYDWVRLDLDGNPRPINIQHAFKNLNFDRKGQRVEEELISKPVLLNTADGCRTIQLPTHEDHFYAVERLEFTKPVTVPTNDQCHVLMLVEGSSITVKTKHGRPKLLNYAETFIIPAAAEMYELINNGDTEAKVVKAFLK